MAHGQLSSLVNASDPSRVFLEVQRTLCALRQSPDIPVLRSLFMHVQNLFAGKVPGYRACNTPYHDFKHTTDMFLATARLIHGADIAGYAVGSDYATLGLLAALLHNTGYIQTEDDNAGTGAKHTFTHVARSTVYMRNLFASNGFSNDAVTIMELLLACTGAKPSLTDVAFPDTHLSQMGKILVTADLIGQMSDRCYLEKLVYLFQELKEAGTPGMDNEVSLLEKTIGFYAQVQRRFTADLGGAVLFGQLHFRERWGLDRDLYGEAIRKQVMYLGTVLGKHRFEFRDRLRRFQYLQKTDTEKT